MQFAAGQLVLYRSINMLLSLDPVQADKLGADDNGRKMLAVAIKGEMFAGHAGEDECFDLIRMHSIQALNFQPRLSRFRVSRDTAAKQPKTTPRLISGATSETPKKP